MRRVAFLGIALCCLLALPVIHAGEKGNPILDAVKKNVSDPAKPFTMVIMLTVKEGKGKDLEDAFVPAIKETRKEKGAIAYFLNRDPKDATKYYLYERWQSVAALQAHLEAPHTKTLLGKAGELFAGAPELKFFEVVGE